jgi:hypothetical protein
MTQQKHQAERLRVGIAGGWLNVSEAVEWADRQIAVSPQPHASLIEIAIGAARTRAEMATLLRDVPGASDPCTVMRVCFADLLAVLEREPALARDVAQWLECVAKEGLLPDAQFGWEATALADAFSLADQTIGTVGDAEARVVAFLRQHAVTASSLRRGTPAAED